MRRCVPITFLLLVSAITAVSQAKEITKQESSDQYYAALERSQNYSRRLTSNLQRYKNGRIFQTERWVYEYAFPNRRVVYEKEYGRSKVRLEEVNIAEKTFCKADTASWKTSKSPCIKGFLATTSQASFQVLGKISSQYSVEDVKLEGAPVKLYRELTRYKNMGPSGEDAGKLMFAEIKYWLNDNGVIMRQETKTWLADSKQVRWVWTDIYEYDPKDLKIEVPIQ